jgi:hypothetical protein
MPVYNRARNWGTDADHATLTIGACAKSRKRLIESKDNGAR